MRLWNTVSLACLYFSGRSYVQGLVDDATAANSDRFQDSLFARTDVDDDYGDSATDEVYSFNELQPYLTLIQYANGTVPDGLMLDGTIVTQFTMPAVANFQVKLTLRGQRNYISEASCSGGTSSGITYTACANNANYAGNTYAVTSAGWFTFLDVRARQEPDEIDCVSGVDAVSNPATLWSNVVCNVGTQDCPKAEGETIKDLGTLALNGVSC